MLIGIVRQECHLLVQKSPSAGAHVSKIRNFTMHLALDERMRRRKEGKQGQGVCMYLGMYVESTLARARRKDELFKVRQDITQPTARQVGSTLMGQTGWEEAGIAVRGTAKGSNVHCRYSAYQASNPLLVPTHLHARPGHFFLGSWYFLNSIAFSFQASFLLLFLILFYHVTSPRSQGRQPGSTSFASRSTQASARIC